MLAGGLGAGLVAASGVPAALASGRGSGGAARRLRVLEREHGVRLGAFGWNTTTGRRVAHRGDELFPMCSVFKTVAVAAVLRDLDRDGTFLPRVVRYTSRDVERAGHAPLTGLPGNLAAGMSVGRLCGAAVSHSDNAAANLLLEQLGGPAAVTAFCRSVGDDVTRLDRWEPELNSAEPGRVTDTTSPEAIGRTYARLVVGKALDPGDRELLAGWLLGNTTGGGRLRAGLPRGWTVAEKTGTGGYGTTHDVGVAWPPGGGPVVMAMLSATRDADAAADEPVIARAATVVATALTRGAAAFLDVGPSGWGRVRRVRASGW
ncbi:class A beta-lactamase [Wenjunlia vitaminophila]|uniref:Beta-lactamase n=1 Tax=Wenjunlia vitaminophila TaxID=76728 RepID=A0A0T6LKS3_WENVI|nr:class A beta-lactamase [Wenjunlia vitaminophila]